MDKVNIVNALSSVYELSNKSNDYEGLVKSINSLKINNLVNYYNHVATSYDYEDKLIIEFIIKILQNLYNNSGVESPVLDEDYDILYEIYLNLDSDGIVGADNPTTNKPKAQHRYPDLRGSLDKIHFLTIQEKGDDKRNSLEEWISKCENRMGRPFREHEMKIKIFPKFDGVSVVFECDKDGNVINALTRGKVKTNEAVVVNHILGAIKFKTYDDWDTEFGVKTEVIVSYSSYEKMRKKDSELKSARSAVSSIINNDSFDMSTFKHLIVVPLRMQNYETKEIIVPGPPIVEYPVCEAQLNDFNSIRQAIVDIREMMRTILDIPVDGVVIQLQDKNIQRILGRDGSINKFEVAYKFVPESKKTKLIDVEFYVGVLGGITPVAKVEPIQMEGNTIISPSLGSIDRFESLGLRKGDEVLIRYDIVPYLYIDDTCERSSNPIISTPKVCPHCNEKLLYDPVLRCANNNCPSRIIGKITNYAEKMNIENISIGIISTLFREGYLTKIEDLYSLKTHRANIIELDGFGKKSFDKITKSIDNVKEVYDYNLLGAIGIPDIGSKIFKSILNIYYIDELKEIATKGDINKLTSIFGIKEKTALKVISGIIQNYNLISFLQKTLIVKHDGRNYKMKVVFTKVRDKEFEKYLDTIDIEVCGSYTKNIDVVICDDVNSTSEKIKKARNDGKRLMTLKEAKSFFKYNK